jgi:acetyltransferase-like isoleucine patch superfamily enzyme
MSVRTYGDKPISFQVEDGGEFFCIGSEVRVKFSKKITIRHDCCCGAPVNYFPSGLSTKSCFLLGRFIFAAMQRFPVQEISGNAPAELDK